ncbi:MAG: glycosyltransferase [Planctomycetes bacterium]|nr:glycosyltransferase [Planctomycetota bacterium]
MSKDFSNVASARGLKVFSSEEAAQRAASDGTPESEIIVIEDPVDREVFKPDPDKSESTPWLMTEKPELLDGIMPAGRSLFTGPVQKSGLLIHASGDWRSIPQALASGVPCLVSAEYAHLITDGWDGLVVNFNDRESLKAALEKFDDDTFRARLAVTARSSSERWDAETIDKRWQRLLTLEYPRLSVVLPTFNRDGLIEEAIANLLAQDYPQIEIIVVNDGSTDNTKGILDGLPADPRLTIIHKKNGRLPRALNTGFENATGEFLTWTSDDNTFKPSALKALARELLLNPDAAMVFSDYDLVTDAATSRLKTGPVSNIRERNIVGACFMYRASAAKRAGEYDPELELAEDYDYWLRLHKVGPLIHLPRCLYNYGDAPDSLTRQMPVEVQMATLKLLEREREHDADWPKAREEMLKNIAMQLKEQGKSGESLQIARQLIASNAANMAGYKAALRALTPGLFLKAFRAVKGVK